MPIWPRRLTAITALVLAASLVVGCVSVRPLSPDAARTGAVVGSLTCRPDADSSHADHAHADLVISLAGASWRPPAGIGLGRSCHFDITTGSDGRLHVWSRRGTMPTLGDLFALWAVFDVRGQPWGDGVSVLAQLPAGAVTVDGTALAAGSDPSRLALADGMSIELALPPAGPPGGR